MTLDALARLVADMRDIPGFPGYRVGDDGSVRCCRTNAGKIGSIWRLRHPTRRKSGHLFVGLFCRGKTRMVGVHTLVLEAFVGVRPNGLQCRHLNGNPADNRLSNLCWGSSKENSADAIRHGTVRRGSEHSAAKLDETRVAEIRRLLAEGEPRKRIARQFGVRDYTIHCIESGLTWKHVPTLEAPSPSRYRPGKLSDADIVEAKQMASRGSLQREIAVRFGVDQAVISRLLNGKSYQEIPS